MESIIDIVNKEFNTLEDCLDKVFQAASYYATEGVKENIGGPFGAGIIQKVNDKYKVLVIERNTVISTKDATNHAEINSIRKAEKILNKIFLDDCILVSTAKSCPMCLSAACWAKIPTLYYGIDYTNATLSGFKDDSILAYLNGKNNHLIKEVLKENNYSEEPFKVWNSLEEKTMY